MFTYQTLITIESEEELPPGVLGAALAAGVKRISKSLPAFGHTITHRPAGSDPQVEITTAAENLMSSIVRGFRAAWNDSKAT